MKRLLIIFSALFLLNGSVFCQKRELGKIKTVMIDPGHGGKKPGAIGKKSKEQDITLSIALKLGETIKTNFSANAIIATKNLYVERQVV